MPRAPLNQTHHIPESPKGPTAAESLRFALAPIIYTSLTGILIQ